MDEGGLAGVSDDAGGDEEGEFAVVGEGAAAWAEGAETGGLTKGDAGDAAGADSLGDCAGDCAVVVKTTNIAASSIRRTVLDGAIIEV